jgi:hypothetical protein
MEYVLRFDGTEDKSTMVVSFPCSFPEGTTVAADMSAVDQLKVIRRLQTDWSDNSVSCTVYYRKEELPEIREYLAANYNDTIKTVSFLLHQDHGFAQAPLEGITKEQYDELKAATKPILGLDIGESDVLADGLESCEGGSCPIK